MRGILDIASVAGETTALDEGRLAMKVLSSLLKTGVLAAVLLFLLMFAAEGALSWGAHGPLGFSSLATDHSDWPTVTGFVVMQETDQNGLVFTTFAYGVGGRPYMGSQSWNGEGQTYSRGERVTIYHDAVKPWISVIDPNKPQAPVSGLLVQPILSALAFVAYGAIVVWVWASCCGSLVRANGRRVPRWSWKPLRQRIWRLVGAGVPSLVAVFLLVRMAAAHDISSAAGLLGATVAVYVVVPFGLALLLRSDNFLSGWMGSLGGGSYSRSVAASAGPAESRAR